MVGAVNRERLGPDRDHPWIIDLAIFWLHLVEKLRGGRRPDRALAPVGPMRCPHARLEYAERGPKSGLPWFWCGDCGIGFRVRNAEVAVEASNEIRWRRIGLMLPPEWDELLVAFCQDCGIELKASEALGCHRCMRTLCLECDKHHDPRYLAHLQVPQKSEDHP